jgi:hypothetical protein
MSLSLVFIPYIKHDVELTHPRHQVQLRPIPGLATYPVQSVKTVQLCKL